MESPRHISSAQLTAKNAQTAPKAHAAGVRQYGRVTEYASHLDRLHPPALLRGNRAVQYTVTVTGTITGTGDVASSFRRDG